MKTFLRLMLGFVLSCFIGLPMADAIGVSAHVVVPSLYAMSFIPMPNGVSFMAVNLNQIIVAELLHRFLDVKDDFLEEVKDYSGKVNNDVFKFNDIGALPDVLINNNTYPISTSARTDEGLIVSLFKLDTKNTSITDDELHALPYDKKSSVMGDHVLALAQKRVILALNSLAPAADSGNTPLVTTSGGAYEGRARLTIDDLNKLKHRCDLLMIPLNSRKLVLCPDHIQDLLAIDNVFRDRYSNIPTGQIVANLSGFKIYENINTPTYDSTGALKAIDAAPATDDKTASVFFSTVNTMKAIGSVSVYYRDATLDPENRMSVFGTRLYYIVSPVNNKGIGGIVSGPAAP